MYEKGENMSKSDSSLSADQLALLKQFKKQIDATSQAPTTTAAKSVVQSTPKPNDDALFLAAMRGVQKIQTETVPHRPTPRTKPDAQILAKRMAAEGAPEQDAVGLSDMQALLNPVASEAFLSYRITTLQNRVFEELKNGKLRWYEAVDLHGCTIEQARQAMLQLIQIATTANENVIKIVHGKGDGAVLKTCVNGWLRQHPAVLAFVSAPHNQGGTGSVLVLLKRRESQSKQPDTRKSHD